MCEIVRADDPDFTFRSEWTMARAQTAGLTGKSVWKQYPAAMLKARAITECARDACPEALSGVQYTAEELGDDSPPTDPSGAAVSEPHRQDDASSAAPEPDVIDAELVHDWQDDLDDATTIDQVRDVWNRYAPSLTTPERAALSHAMTARKEELEAVDSGDDLDAGDAEPGETDEPAAGTADPSDGDSASPATRTDLKNLSATLTRAGITDRQDCLDIIGGWIGRVIGSRNELTHAEAIKATLAAGQLVEAVAS